MTRSGFMRFFSNLVYYTLCVPLGKSVNHLGFRIRIRGKGNLASLKGQGFISVSNHTLYSDPMLISDACFPRRVLFTMYEAHLQIPLIGRFIKLMGGFPLPVKLTARNHPLIENMLQEALHDARIIHFFPEGHLLHCNQTLQKFHPGAFYYAVRYGVSVVPITTVVFPWRWRGKINHWLPPRVELVIGEPILKETWEALPTVHEQVEFLSNVCFE